MILGYDCDRCKHFDSDDEEYPCAACKGTASPAHKEYVERPLLFEPVEEDSTQIVAVEEINHPPRYKHGEYECIDVMVDVFGKEATEHFCLLSAFKYVWRKDYKGGIQDIKKAMWYLDKYLELEGEKRE